MTCNYCKLRRPPILVSFADSRELRSHKFNEHDFQWRPRRWSKRPDITDERVVALRHRGLSLRSIARLLGTDHQSIRARLIRAQSKAR